MTKVTKNNVLDANYVNSDSLPWIPTGMGSMEMKVCKVNTITGQFVVLVRYPADGSPVPSHRHHGTVIVYTVSGKWGYKEDKWISGPGDVVYEPACSTHTPINYPEFGEVVTFVIIDGALEILDEQGQTLYILNAEAAINMYQQYCQTTGTVPVDVTQF
ncbi:2,4'-dihydroxyacetophenone dioxygenase family protein [Rossellomorea aquimaris]|uniref:2,4'-dihydroxyacetophenone dioxygenase family protein n=1 Tax=Rossellomorea aquimaris TaxID=189382 RepID=UPI003CEBECA3